MSASSTSAGGPDKGPLAALMGNNDSMLSLLLKYIGLFIFDAFGLIVVYALLEDDNMLLALIILLITIMMNVFILVPRLYPFKWMSPGLALVTLLVIYPIIYTVITAFSNYSDGHLLTKGQTIDLVERRMYLPEGAEAFSATVFQAGEGEYALWLVSDAGETYFARAGEPFEAVEPDPDTEDGIPNEFDGYQRMEKAALVQAANALQGAKFGEGAEAVQVTSISPRRGSEAQQVQQQYTYDAELDAIFDHANDTYYYANAKYGCFVPDGITAPDSPPESYDLCRESGVLTPGYRVSIGFHNFSRLVNDPGLRGPMIDIFVWTVAFAFFSVITTFALGLFMAIIMDDPSIPGRKAIRSLLIIPYAIPGVISLLVWRGMLNMNLGVITLGIEDIFGVKIPWFADPWAAKVAILIVNLWLGYPYMMLICSGALQSIPSAIYEAASVDGANQWNKFWRITLPLLLVTVGPLLIASFTFNFNNYLIIEALTEGDPPMAHTVTPAGYSDILINYTYNLAFGSNRGADYGYASAITLIIFSITAGITLAQYRFTKTWEEVGENV